MKVLPNGVKVFNSTPHPVTFWRDDWAEVVTVEKDELISATAQEITAGCYQPLAAPDWENIWFVRTEFVGNEAGRDVIRRAKAAGAEVIVGSIIAAQAYPGDVVAMVPAPGYERMPPDQKRMMPDKFTFGSLSTTKTVLEHTQLNKQEILEK